MTEDKYLATHTPSNIVRAQQGVCLWMEELIQVSLPITWSRGHPRDGGHLKPAVEVEDKWPSNEKNVLPSQNPALAQP